MQKKSNEEQFQEIIWCYKYCYPICYVSAVRFRTKVNNKVLANYSIVNGRMHYTLVEFYIVSFKETASQQVLFEQTFNR